MLSRGERGVFRAMNGTVVRGRVLFVFNGVYMVCGERLCTMYSDGLYRFREQDRINEDGDPRHLPPRLRPPDS